MQHQFEIKIFANPSGFQELKLNSVENLFSKEIVEKRNFDGDYGTFKEGTFSVLFTPNAFIIDYIFNVVADAGFRDPQTHIAIAIERGCKLKDAYQVFKKLRKEFNSIAAESKVNITRTLYSKSEIFNKIVEDNIEFAPDQFRISAGEVTVIKRALASYETEEQLNSLLEEPNRLKFGLYGLVFFLKKIEASELYKKESINKYYAPIIMDDKDFDFKVSYEVIFPDNYSVTIKSRSEEIDHTCSKMYYQSERFYGVLNEHMQDWEVTQSEDRTKFIIGKKLVPEIKELKIKCVDIQMNSIATPESFVFTLGKFNAQESILLLTGEEIDKSIECRSADDRIKPLLLGRKGDVIVYKIIRQYCYDISAVFRHVYKTTKEEIKEIKIYQKKNRVPLAVLTKSDPPYYTDLIPDNLEYEIPETKKFLTTRAGFENDCRPCLPHFQRKDTVDVLLVIKNESIVNNLEQKPVCCTFKSAHDESDEKYPQECFFDVDGRLIIRELPLGEFSYKIEIAGYKEEKGKLTLYQKDKKKTLEITFERTAWNKTKRILNKCKGGVAVFFIGLGLGGFIRPYIDVPIDNGTGNREIDSLKAEISKLEQDTLSLSERVCDLQLKVQSLDSIQKDYETRARKAIDIVKGGPGKDEESHPDIVRKILTELDNNAIETIKKDRKKNKYYYQKLSQKEQTELDQIFDDTTLFDAFKSIRDRKKKFENVNTFQGAIEMLTKQTKG